MFFVFNKDKIYTYCISIITIILLFCVAYMMKEDEQSTLTSTTQEEIQAENTCINFP